MRQFKYLIAVLLIRVSGYAAGLYPFVLPWDDVSPGPTDLRHTIPKPAGAQGFIKAEGNYLYLNGQRVKLFGVNFTASANCPDHDTAIKSASRLAKLGINAVRLHFLDATWDEPQLINYKSGNWQNWNADALDRFDFWMAQLKAQGIYLNLNLLVGRRFAMNDGVDPSINKLDWKLAHAMGFFDPDHLRAQQAYARALLSHVNPYTGLAYKDDPAVAIVEIINENGLIHSWMSEEFSQLPTHFANKLQKQWNQWLQQRYPDTATLAKGWGSRSEPLDKEMLATSIPQTIGAPWILETHEGAWAEHNIVDDSAQIVVKKPGKADWHVQMHHADLNVQRDAIYTLKFKAKADRERRIYVSLMQAHAPWQELGFGRSITLTPRSTEFVFTFLAREDDDNARINFGAMSQSGATFNISGVSLKGGGAMGLMVDETLEMQSIKTLRFNDTEPKPAAMKDDWIKFLRETERAYWRAMRKFLKEDLGVKSLLVGTSQFTSTPHLQAEFDMVDAHAYWQHPRFPGRAWDNKNWLIDNVSMVERPKDATVTSLAWQRVRGKPFMVSEYNHPAPNVYAGEGPLFLATVGAQQDWDAIFMYNYSAVTARRKAGQIPDFFDIAQHPTILANLQVASLIFRRDQRASGRLWPPEIIPLPEEDELKLIAGHGHAWSVVPYWKLGRDWQTMLQNRVYLDLNIKGPVFDVVTSRNGFEPFRINWQTEEAKGVIFEARTPSSTVYIGNLDGQKIQLTKSVMLEFGTTRRHWNTLALTELEPEANNSPRRQLLVLTGYVENSDMGWHDQTLSTVGNKWGKAPTLVESIPATIYIQGSEKLPKVYPLDGCGQRQTLITFANDGQGGHRAILGTTTPTLWYELEW